MFAASGVDLFVVVALNWSASNEVDLFELSRCYGGDEVPLQGLALERLRDRLSVEAGITRPALPTSPAFDPSPKRRKGRTRVGGSSEPG